MKPLLYRYYEMYRNGIISYENWLAIRKGYLNGKEGEIGGN